MKKIKTCFSPRYYADTPTASMRKLPLVAAEVEKSGYAELIDPGALDPAILQNLHDPLYVEQFCTGGILASSQGWEWSPQIRDGVLAINAGQLRAAQLALEHGIAANIGQGFHHATYSSGGGFCTFNGLALVAQQYSHLRVGVLDCDEHQGNGTEEFTERLENLFNFTIYGSPFGKKGKNRSINRYLPRVTRKFNLYKEALQDGFCQIKEWDIQLLIYQAGADPHTNDPLGRLGLTTQQLFERDRLVFDFIHKSHIPSFFVLAGGYQEPIETALVPLHVQTFKAAVEAFS
jgi:acetoin utilization deacetylase AcuC-like enzyme